MSGRPFLFVPDPGIEIRIQYVCHEVGENHPQNYNEHAHLKDLVILLYDGVKDEFPHTGQGENLLGDKRPTYQLSELQTRHCHHGE